LRDQINKIFYYFKMDLKEIGWDCMDLIGLAQDRDQWRALVNTVMNLRVHFFVASVGLSPCGHFWPIVPATDDK
jgi:hypothetical protein